MVPFVNRQSVSWSKAMTYYMFDLCLLSQYGFIYKSAGWYKLTKDQQRKAASEFETAFDSKRFLTNDTGLDKNYNPIGEEVLGEAHRNGSPRQWEVACGGNIIKAKSHTPVRKIATDVDGVKRPVDCIEVEVWDGKNPAPNALTFNWRTHPWLVHMATIATPFGYDGQLSKTGPWKVDPFSFFGGAGTPYTMLFSSPNYVPLHRIERLKVSELYQRPYKP